MFNTSTRRRHIRLMRLARKLVGECQRRRILGRPGPIKAAPGELISLAFGQQLQLDEDEALRYLEAARVEQGLCPDILAYAAILNGDLDDEEPYEIEAPVQA
ncbi:hypothetical protein ACOKM5_44435 [Streptomyces sp. BH097]|uniref:hypothetical protein n=1 Tax=Streptomyces sp. BH097 TaxID=3410406 RepID=UPI003CED6073